MPKFDIDLTTADVIADGDYVAIIKRAEVRDNKEGTSQYVSWLLQIPTAGNRTIFHATSFSVPRMVKAMMDASKTPYDTSGFDPDGAIGKQINIRVGQKDDPTYGIQNVVVKVWAV